jgi:D-sedoheptulose 7-phosphate isomerase
MDYGQSYAEEVQATLGQLPWEDIQRVVAVLHNARLDGRQVFVLGNGGSAATASHFACDLGKGAQVAEYPGLRAIALTDNMAIFSAYANDCGYEQVFTRQLASLLQPGDVVIGISGSGNSANVLNAIQLGRERGATTVGFVGFDGGRLKGLVDVCLHVANHCMEQVEDVHVVLGHMIATVLRQIAARPRFAPDAP